MLEFEILVGIGFDSQRFALVMWFQLIRGRGWLGFPGMNGKAQIPGAGADSGLGRRSYKLCEWQLLGGKKKYFDTV